MHLQEIAARRATAADVETLAELRVGSDLLAHEIFKKFLASVSH